MLWMRVSRAASTPLSQGLARIVALEVALVAPFWLSVTFTVGAVGHIPAALADESAINSSDAATVAAAANGAISLVRDITEVPLSVDDGGAIRWA
jgi:hypothetical protein